MSKFIRLDTAITDTTAPFAVMTPGVGGYGSRYIAKHLQAKVGDKVSEWVPVDGGDTLTLSSAGPSTLTLQEEAGLRFVRSPGDSNAGGRLLGPHTAQRPLTMAAVVRATVAGTTAIIGTAGMTVGYNTAPVWSGSGGGVSAYTTNSRAGWVFVMVQATAANTVRVRADAVEAENTTQMAAPPTSFGGIYFGPGPAARPADLAELIYWPRELSKAERDAVHAYMRAQYPVLP